MTLRRNSVKQPHIDWCYHLLIYMLLALSDELLLSILQLSTIQDCKNVVLCCQKLRDISLDILYTKVAITGNCNFIHFVKIMPMHHTKSLTI